MIGTRCTFSGCGRKTFAKGLCRGHYLQDYAGEPLTPIEVKRKSRDRNDPRRIWIGRTAKSESSR